MRVEGTGLLSSLQRYMEEMRNTSRQIATGRRINSASDNPAALAMAEKLNAVIRELFGREGNLQDMINMTQTAEGGLSNIGDILQRMRELAVQAGNGTLTAEDRASIQAEFEQLREELNRINTDTQFNNQRLLNASAEDLNISDINLTTPEGAQEALGRLDEAIRKVASDRGNLGALINGYQARISNYQVQRENTMASYSRMVDTDLAQAITEQTRFYTLSQVGMSAVKSMIRLMRMQLNLLG